MARDVSGLSEGAVSATRWLATEHSHEGGGSTSLRSQHILHRHHQIRLAKPVLQRKAILQCDQGAVRPGSYIRQERKLRKRRPALPCDLLPRARCDAQQAIAYMLLALAGALLEACGQSFKPGA
jgi:hypothetical protein